MKVADVNPVLNTVRADVPALKAAGDQLFRLGKRMAGDEEFVARLLSAAIQGETHTLLELCKEAGVQPAAMGPVSKTSGEVGVRAASYWLRFDAGRFRLSLVLDER
jgi:hypothetical protein